MTCRQLIEFLAEYLDGGLTVEERAHFEGHLSRCRDCRSYLESYQQTIRLVHASGAYTDHFPTPPMPEELVLAVTLSARHHNFASCK